MGAATATEGALKLKEISYLHAEAYPAGEMKHGPIALIDEGFPVIAIATKSPTYEKVLSNLQESKARGAMVVAIATQGDEEIGKYADHVIFIPKVRDELTPLRLACPWQLFARAIALERRMRCGSAAQSVNRHGGIAPERKRGSKWLAPRRLKLP